MTHIPSPDIRVSFLIVLMIVQSTIAAATISRGYRQASGRKSIARNKSFRQARQSAHEPFAGGPADIDACHDERFSPSWRQRNDEPYPAKTQDAA
jgi:hypothetical protein